MVTQITPQKEGYPRKMKDIILNKSAFYLYTVIIIILSVVLWYNFNSPPIAANTGFPVNIFRYVNHFYLPFNFYSWPVSFNPMVSYLPGTMLMSFFSLLADNNYSVSYFIYNIFFEVMGGMTLFYLSSEFLSKYKIPPVYSMLSVVFYAFNVALILDSGTFETGTAQLIIIIFLIYMSIYRSKYYIFLLGFASFFIMYPFPGGGADGGLILIEEFIFVILVFLIRNAYDLIRIRGKLTSLFLLMLSMGASVALSLSYLVFIIFASGSKLLEQSVSLHPVYVFGFIYDWISVFPNAIRLIGNWGVYTVYAGPWVSSYLANPLISVLLYVVPFLSVMSIIFLKREHYYIFFLMILSMFAATTVNPPFGNIFEAVILKVGPLRAFYESASYYPILITFYSLLFP